MTCWEDLPYDIINVIMIYRKNACYKYKAIKKIQALWKSYKIRTLINRYKSLQNLIYLRKWNPNIEIYLSRSVL